MLLEGPFSPEEANRRQQDSLLVRRLEPFAAISTIGLEWSLSYVLRCDLAHFVVTGLIIVDSI